MPRIETSGADAAAIAQCGPEHMRAIAAGLTERGLTARLTDHRVGLDLTATLSPAHLRGAEFWIDEDGYAELRFWYPPGTPPAQITATALRALDAVKPPARDRLDMTAMFGPALPTLDDVAREFSRWHCWEGVADRLYASLRHSSPPLVVAGTTPLALRQRIRDAEAQR